MRVKWSLVSQLSRIGMEYACISAQDSGDCSQSLGIMRMLSVYSALRHRFAM